MNLAATATGTPTAPPGWPAAQAADGDRDALAELVERYLDSVFAVVSFLGGEQRALDGTARVAADAARTASWSREEELASQLFRCAVAAGSSVEETAGSPELPRAALALVDLADRSLEDAAGDLAIGKPELRAALTTARTSLRRARRALAGGGRCLRARRLLSDSLDEGLGETESALLRAHLANCLRCPEHEELLSEELEALYGRFRRPAPAEVRRAVREALGAEAKDEGEAAEEEVAAEHAPLVAAPAESAEPSDPGEPGEPAFAELAPMPRARATNGAGSAPRPPAPTEPSAQTPLEQPATRRAQARTPSRAAPRPSPGLGLRRIAAALAIATALAGAAFGIGEGVSALDRPPSIPERAAPWAQPDAPAIPPRLPE